MTNPKLFARRTTTVRITLDTHRKLKKAAMADGRALVAFVDRILNAALAAYSA